MKTGKLLTSLLAISAGPLAASAATVSASLNDLIVGFYATGGTGASVNLEVNLGNVAQFYNVSGQITFSGLSATDLSGTYGSNWNTRTDLFWGVAGTTGAASGTTIGGNPIAAKTLWGGQAQTTLGVSSSGWNTGTTFAQQGPAGTIAGLYSGLAGSLNGAISTANSTVAATINNTLNGSWSKAEGTTAAAFGYFNPKTSFDGSTNIVGNYAAMDLYQLQPNSGAATLMGTFALSGDGMLTYGANFSAATVPEPSTYAALLGAAALGFGAYRRRGRRTPDAN
jgi:hypothetical protein